MSTPQNLQSELQSRLSNVPKSTVIIGSVLGGFILLCCGCPIAVNLMIPDSVRQEIAQERENARVSEDLRRKAAEAKQAREAAAAAATEAQAKEQRAARAQKSLDNFTVLLATMPGAKDVVLKTRKVDDYGDERVEITVANSWHVKPYQIRLQSAQNLGTAWFKATGLKDPVDARISIVDVNGNEVGGTGVLGIWVQEN